MEKHFIKELKEKILGYDIISFDIFDTLMFRLVSRPEDIFYIMEKNLNIKEFSRIRQIGQRDASLNAEKIGYPHADMDEIYNYLKNNYHLECDWDEVKKYEIELENDALYANMHMKEIFNFAKENGKRVIAVSDMYLKKAEIEKFLNSCGYVGFDEIYISSDIRKTKYRYDLFEYVIDKENVNAENILHIGDNYEADYVNAKKCGINAVHYNIFMKDDNKFEDMFDSVDKGAEKIIEARGLEDFWYEIGVKVGGSMYLGLIRWIEDKIKKAGKIDKIYFLARDGFNLYNIFKGLGYKNIEYLYASRRAMLLAGIDELNEEALSSLPPYTFYQSVGEILTYLDFTGIDEESVKKCGFSGFNDTIRGLCDFNKMKRLYKLNEAYVLKKCKEERQYAENYFESIGLLNSKSIIFDCGWNGSSQYLLDKILKLVNYKGENKFLYSGIMNTEKSRRQLKGKKYECYFFGHNFNNDIEDKVRLPIVIFELFFGANHNSVWKYRENGYELEELEKEQNHKNSILMGITDYVKLTHSFVDKYNIEIEPRVALRKLLLLINEPNEREALNIGNLKNVDGFVAQKGVEKYVAKLSLFDYLKNPKTEIYWPQAIIKRPDTNFILKNIIRKKYGIKNGRIKAKKSSVFKISFFGRFIEVLKREGVATTFFLIKRRLYNTKSVSGADKYQEWIRVNETDILKTTSLEYKPLISVVVPVYNVLSEQLIECIESVKAQTFDNWELCLVDDFSSWESVRDVLKNYENDSRIKILYRKENGHISRATNDGINMSRGEFIAFLDCDDILAPNAIYEVTKRLNENNRLDFIYSDEDKLTENGKLRHSPFFKPDWSPDTFMSLMYTCHFSVYRKSIVDKINGLNIGVEGAQDYDFTLRFTENAKTVGHIPKILYHWRERPESIASDPEAKPYALEAIKKLKQEALKRRGLDGNIVYSNEMFQFTVDYKNNDGYSVSIIIQSDGDVALFNKCLNSIKKSADNFELICVFSKKAKGEKKSFTQICEKNNCIALFCDSMNRAELFNKGTKGATGNQLIFIEEGCNALSANWIGKLAGYAELEHIGAVGAKILFSETDLIYHSGITSLKGYPVFSFKGYSDSSAYYYGRNKLDYNVSAVCGGIIAVDKKKFELLNGFDENFDNGFYDVDLCYRFIEKGFFNVLKNNVIFEHCGNDKYDDFSKFTKEIKLLKEKNPVLCGYDPFYNVNLTKNKSDFDIGVAFDIHMSKVVKESFDISMYSGEDILIFIDSIDYEEKYVVIEGWSFINKFCHNNFNKKYLTLTDEENNTRLIQTETLLRNDVTSAFNENGSKTLSGFRAVVSINGLKAGKYMIGIFIKNNVYPIKRFAFSGRNLFIK